MRNYFHLPDADVYDIKSLKSMSDLLIPETSLCIVHIPQSGRTNGTAAENGPSTADRVLGISDSGKEEMLLIRRNAVTDQGRSKRELDDTHLTFLFIPWHRRRGHLFRMFRRHELLAEFPDFDAAMKAYMPDGFTPVQYYRFAHSIRGLYCCSAFRHDAIRDLLRVLHRHAAKLSLKTSGHTAKGESKAPSFIKRKEENVK